MFERFTFWARQASEQRTLSECIWSEKSDHVREYCHRNEANPNAEHNRKIADPVKPLQTSFLEPIISRSVYVTYSTPPPPISSTVVLTCGLLVYVVMCPEHNDTLHAMKR